MTRNPPKPLILFSTLALFVFAPLARADIRTEPVEYRDGPTICKGFVAYDDASENVRPGILVVPEWWGLTDYPKHRAVQLAQLGYVAFVADMYGQGQTTDNPKQAGALAAPFHNDRNLMRRRAQAGVDALLAQKYVDKNHIAAIGYCFGGTAVLELARAGTPLAGVVSFHGDLSRSPNEGPDNIKCPILICHGADDPFAPLKTVFALADELKQANARFEINIYSGAVHAFTNPDADSHHMNGIAYNAQADHASWQAMLNFFHRIFQK